MVTAIRLTDPFLFLTELQAPPFRLIFDWFALGLLLAAAFALGRRKTVSPFFLLLLAAAAFAAFRARRDIWFVVIVSVIILGSVRIPVRLGRATLGARQIVPAALAVLVIGIALGVTRTSPAQLARATAENFPVDAAAFVEKHGYHGPLYNHYNWGGYLMWRLPSLDVSLDGRNPVHGDTRIWQSIRTWAGRPGWATDPELAAARLVIADANAPLSSLLRRDSRFDLVYEDRVAIVFIGRQ